MKDHPDEVIERFEGQLWHDSKLLGITICRTKNDIDEVVLHLLMWPTKGANLAPATVRFRECALVRLDIDLDAKKIVADDISTGQCLRKSEWMDAVERANPYDQPLKGFLHFRIQLIPPGGDVNFVAKGFEISFLPAVE